MKIYYYDKKNIKKKKKIKKLNKKNDKKNYEIILNEDIPDNVENNNKENWIDYIYNFFFKN